MDITSLVKEYVGAVTKGSGKIEILIERGKMYINLSDTALAIIDISDMSYLERDMAFLYISKMLIDTDTTPYQERVAYDIHSILDYIGPISHDNIVARCDSLLDIPEYAELIKRKATEGAGFYTLPGQDLYTNYMIPVFAGFPIINAKDNAGIYVLRDSKCHGNLINIYEVYKHKINKVVQIIFRTVDLNVSLRDNMIRS